MASRLMARGIPRAWAWMARTASSENRVSVRPARAQVARRYPSASAAVRAGAGIVVAELDPLVQGGHVADPEPAPQGGLADEHDGGRGPVIDPGVGQHPDRLELVVGEEVRLIDRDDDVPVFLLGLGGEGGLDLGDEGGVVEAGGLAERGGHRAVQAAHPDLGVGQVDQGMPGGVQAVGGGAEGDSLPRADLPGKHPRARGRRSASAAGRRLLCGQPSRTGRPRGWPSRTA